MSYHLISLDDINGLLTVHDQDGNLIEELTWAEACAKCSADDTFTVGETESVLKLHEGQISGDPDNHMEAIRTNYVARRDQWLRDYARQFYQGAETQTL